LFSRCTSCGMELYIPADILGVAIAEPLHLSRKTDGLFVFVSELVKCYGLLLLNFMLQLWLLHKISGVNESKMGHQTKCPEGIVTQVVCVFVFEASIFIQLKECRDNFCMLYYTQAVVQGSYAMANGQSRGAVLVQTDNSLFSRITKKVRPTPPKDVQLWSLDYITPAYKVWSVLVIVLPQTLIVLAVAYQGGLFIAMCEDTEDIVLNSLAVTFILDIGEIIYHSFTPHATKSALESAKAVEIELSNNERYDLWIKNKFVYPLLVTMWSMWLVWRGVTQLGCPDDEFDELKMKYLKLLHLA